MQNNMREMRKQKGLTQNEVARALGKDQTTISNWEKGKYQPNYPELLQLSNLYGVSVETLVKAFAFGSTA